MPLARVPPVQNLLPLLELLQEQFPEPLLQPAPQLWLVLLHSVRLC